jgi:hypothetical protein
LETTWTPLSPSAEIPTAFSLTYPACCGPIDQSPSPGVVPSAPLAPLRFPPSGRSYLAGVHVGQVKRVTGEVNTTGRVALDQVGVVVAYYDTMLGAALEWCPCLKHFSLPELAR